MNNSNYTFGMILMLAGALLLLNNFDLLHINLHEVLKFWPLLLVYTGLALLVKNQKGWALALAMLIITAIAVGLYIFFNKYEDNIPFLNNIT
ncbi:MAG: hypothetical protein HUU47_03100 [Bacteroidetes bacterium]|nr:hypothetical protein [Bacteroidota bacterium]